MHHTSHYDPLLPLYCSTRYSQLPLITRGWTEHQFGCHSMSSSSRKWQYERAFHRNCEIEPLFASNETIPFSPNQLVNLGHHLKDEQLRRPQGDKMVRKGCYVSVRWSGTTSCFFFSSPGTLWIQGAEKVCSNQVSNMAYLEVTCRTAKL